MKYRIYNKLENRYDDGKLFTGQDGNVWSLGMGKLLPLANQHNYAVEVWTGLKDNNGKELFEGDIIKYSVDGEEYIDFVEYCVEKYNYPAFDLSETDWNSNTLQTLLESSDFDGFEIIGNINENLELLKN